MEKFEKLLGKSHPLMESVKDRNFDTPSEIQEKSIPEIVKGKDVIAIASTGSGKTLAFAAGLINNIEEAKGLQGLVLAPTRELAEQVAKEVRSFSKPKGLRVAAVYGGVSMGNQIKELKTAEIVVATPGRMLDHLQRNTIDFKQVNTLVLDEADRMFDMGFRDDIRKIIMKCPDKRQTMLFSATISGEVINIAEKYMDKPIEIYAEPQVDPKKLTQVYYDAGNDLKYSLLIHLLKNEKSKLIMIFCNTRMNVDFIANNLKANRLDAVPIHGGFSQEKRNKMIESFQSNKVNILVATDVAARGLHIDNISHIYNYDAPTNKDEYTHRIGRTARAGKEGKVINILGKRDYENFRNVMKGDFKVEKIEMPRIERAKMSWIPQRGESWGQRGRSPQRRSSGGPRRDSHGSGGRSSGGRTSGGRSSGGPRRDSPGSGGRTSGGRDSGRSSGERSESNYRGGSGHRRDSRSGGSGGRKFGGRDSRTHKPGRSGGRRDSRR